MRTRILSALLVAPATMALTIGGTATAAATEGTTHCPRRMIFEVGGTHDPGALAYDRGNERRPAGVEFTKIRYPGEIAPLAPGDAHTFDESVAAGKRALSAEVRRFHGNCPGVPITVSGYSQGAVVAGDVIAALAAGREVPRELVDGVLYSDPRRVPVRGRAGGIMTNLPTFAPGVTMRGARSFGGLPVHTICQENDGMCNSANPLTNLPAFANGLAGFALGDHDYDIDPYRDRGNGDTLIDQVPRIPYGPSLPLPLPTLHQIFDGNRFLAQVAMAELRGKLLPLVPPEIRARADSAPDAGLVLHAAPAA